MSIETGLLSMMWGIKYVRNQNRV